MSKQEELEAIKKLQYIERKMEWKTSELYEKLYEHFKKVENINITVNLDTFRSQYSTTRGGSTKYFPQYVEYIYNLDEVQKRLLDTDSKVEKRFFILLFLFMFLLLILASYDPDNITLADMGGECVNNCLKQHPNYRIDKEGVELDDFRIVRNIKKALTD